MIPPDVMARAREAFDEVASAGGKPKRGFDAALSVLSAAWPEADGRLREASDDDDTIIEAMSDAAEAEGWNVGRDDRDERHAALAVMRLMLRAARRASAALSTPSAPAADVRIVRVAVAEDEAGRAESFVIRKNEDDRTWKLLRAYGYSTRLCIAEIPVPIRDVPTVRATVTEVGNGA